MVKKSKKSKDSFLHIINLFRSFIGNMLMVLFSITCIFPVVWLILSSLKTETEFTKSIIALPEKLYLENYIDIIFNSNILFYMLNSIKVTVISLLGIILIGYVTAYFIARYNNKLIKAVFVYYLIGMLIPIHALMIPVFIVFDKFSLTNNLMSLVFSYVAFGIPIAIFLIQSYIKNIPIEIEEAAAIDGSTFSKTLFRIIFPICRPIIITVGIIQLFACWNEFPFALTLITDDSLRTIPLGLTMLKGQYTNSYTRTMTSMVVSMLPVIIIYFSFSKQIVKGMVAGAVKG